MSLLQRLKSFFGRSPKTSRKICNGSLTLTEITVNHENFEEYTNFTLTTRDGRIDNTVSIRFAKDSLISDEDKESMAISIKGGMEFDISFELIAIAIAAKIPYSCTIGKKVFPEEKKIIVYIL